MIPILYGPQETAFTSNGICRLIDAITCEVTEERNGIYELEMTYPVTGRNYEKILEGCIIYVTHDDSREPQPFDIYKRSVPIDGIVTFYASHISYRLNKMVLSPYVAITCADAFAQIPTHTIGVDNPFSFWTDKVVTSASPFSVTYPKAIKNALGGSEGSILDVFGTGEYEFDKWAVKFHQHRGTDTGLVIRYGKNMTDLTDESDVGGTNNGVAPYWAGGDAGVVMLPEQWISSGGWQMYGEDWTTYTGDTMTNENGQTLEWTYSPNEIIPLDLSGEFSEAPTQAQLRQKAISLFNQSESWLGTRTIEVDFVKLSDTDEYADVAPLQDVLLCDTVTIVHDGVSVRVKVVKTVYDSLLDRYAKLELGDAKLTFGMMIKDGAITAATAGVASLVNGSVQKVAEVVSGVNGGNIVILYDEANHPYELLILEDTADYKTAQSVWRWNKDGLMHSSNGYDGDYSDIAITADGRINADLITTGTLSADRVRAGTLMSVDGTTYWDLDSGSIHNTNSDNSLEIAISGARIRFIAQGELVGSVGGARFLNDGGSIVGYGSSFTAEKDFLALGFKDPDLDTAQYCIIINNGLFSTPSEHVYFLTSVAFRNTVTWYAPAISSETVPQKRASILNSTIYTGKSTYPYANRAQPVLRLQPNCGFTIDYTDGTNSTWMVRLDAGYNDVAGCVYVRRLFVGMSAGADSGENFSVNVDGYFSYNVYAQNFIKNSDARLKNVDGWDPRYLELLDRIDPVLFHWKDADADDDQHIGYIAQDVKKEIDDLGIEGIVSKRGEYLSINYDELSTLLQAKVKQQQKRIDELEKRLEKAEGMIEKLCEFLSYQS